jgi:hypothetical protein
MTLTAATATTYGPARLIGLALIGTLLVSAWYVLACAMFPFTNCPKCDGSGKKRDQGGRGRNWRNCKRCKGTGKRIRVGRRIYNYLRKLEKDAT